MKGNKQYRRHRQPTAPTHLEIVAVDDGVATEQAPSTADAPAGRVRRLEHLQRVHSRQRDHIQHQLKAHNIDRFTTKRRKSTAQAASTAHSTSTTKAQLVHAGRDIFQQNAKCGKRKHKQPSGIGEHTNNATHQIDGDTAAQKEKRHTRHSAAVVNPPGAEEPDGSLLLGLALDNRTEKHGP